MQGDSPKTLAIRFEKQNCIEYMMKAEEDCKIPEFYKSKAGHFFSSCFVLFSSCFVLFSSEVTNILVILLHTMATSSC